VTPQYYKYNSKDYCQELYHKNGNCNAFKLPAPQPTTIRLYLSKMKRTPQESDEDTNTSMFLAGSSKNSFFLLAIFE
jgi:hypothetical protein